MDPTQAHISTAQYLRKKKDCKKVNIQFIRCENEFQNKEKQSLPTTSPKLCKDMKIIAYFNYTCRQLIVAGKPWPSSEQGMGRKRESLEKE